MYLSDSFSIQAISGSTFIDLFISWQWIFPSPLPISFLMECWMLCIKKKKKLEIEVYNIYAQK